MYILFRNNTLLYREENFIILKNLFRELKIKYTEIHYHLLIEIFKNAETEITLEKLLDLIGDDAKKREAIRLIKMLSKIGSIFLYKNTIEEISEKWLPLLKNYSLQNGDINSSVNKLKNLTVSMSQATNKKVHDLCTMLKEMDVNFLIDNSLDDLTFSIQVNENVDIFTLTKRGLHVIGNFYNEKPDLREEKEQFEINFIQEKLLPYYLSVVILKFVISNQITKFVLNDEGQFEEFPQNSNSIFNVISDTFINNKNIFAKEIERIGFIEKKLLKLGLPFSLSDNTRSNFSDLYQVGFTVYGLQEKESAMNFIHAGLDYENNALITLIKGIEFYFEKNTNDSWFVSTDKEYFKEKAEKIVQFIDETYSIKYVPKCFLEGLSYFSLIKNSLEDLNCYILHFSISNSYKIVIEDTLLGKFYTDNKKTYFLNKKLEDILINYHCWKENNTLNFYNILLEVEALDKDRNSIMEDVSLFNIDYNSRNVIEYVKKIIKPLNIGYTEYKWELEDQFAEAGLMIRKIEVGEYD